MSRNNRNSRTYITMTGRGAVERIRTPSKSDVLLGRGGGINGHVGNQTFRNWVGERKEDYNLAGSKLDKTKVATEVMDRVKRQSPPGRFLQREASSTGMGSSNSWWVEVDFNRALSKTSQALREGAPKIRAAHKTELQAAKVTGKRKQPSTMPANKTAKRKQPNASAVKASGVAWPQTVPLPASNDTSVIVPRPSTRIPPTAEQLPRSSLARPLMSNREFHRKYDGSEDEPLSKRPRSNAHRGIDVDAETPPLLPAAGSMLSSLPPLSLHAIDAAPTKTKKSILPRTHSLAFSDLSTPVPDDDFINPFLDETEVLESPVYKTAGEKTLPTLPNKQPLLRNVSSNSQKELSREDYRSMAELYDFPTNDETNPSDSFHSESHRGGGQGDFNEEMKQMWDIVQPDGDITAPTSNVNQMDSEEEPTLFIPWRGGVLKRRYATYSPKKRNSDPNRSNSSSNTYVTNQ